MPCYSHIGALLLACLQTYSNKRWACGVTRSVPTISHSGQQRGVRPEDLCCQRNQKRRVGDRPNMKPKTRLLSTRVGRSGVSAGTWNSQLLVFCRAAVCPERNGWGTVRTGNNWRGAFRTAVHFALIRQSMYGYILIISLDILQCFLSDYI